MKRRLNSLWFVVIIIGVTGYCLTSFCADLPADRKILIVDDFASSSFPWQKWWKEALAGMGIQPVLAKSTELNKSGQSGPIRLENFPIVVWHTGMDEKDTLSGGERSLLAAYLEKGGNLLLTGAGVAQDLIQTGERTWLKRYLRCDFLMPNSPIIEGSVYEHESLVGAKGSIFEGIRFVIDHGEYDTYPADNLNLIYEDVDALAGGGGAIHSFHFEKIPGNLGIQFEGPILPGKPPCRVLFFTFPLETVHPVSARTEILSRSLKFFSAPVKNFYELRGIVKSEAGANPLLENAVVSLKGTPCRTLSRKDGSFVLSGIPEGAYDLEASLFRFSPLSVPNTILPLSGNTPLILSLKPAPTPLVEGRGVWIVRNEITSPEAVKKIVDRCAQAGFNALFVQVRGRGDAFYKSATEPRADALAGQPEDFDPLAMFVELAHAKNMQVHAWMNTFLTYEGGKKPSSPRHILNRHPEWVLTNRAGRLLSEYTKEELDEHHGEGVYLSPCIPEVRAYLVDVYLEVVRNYNVDGIHFDFVRFPFSGNRIDSDWDLGYGKLEREAFKKEHGLDPLDINPKDKEKVQLFNDWRRQCVSRLVEDVHKRAHELKPEIRVSGAVLERYHLVRDVHCFQDWIEWLQSGKIDTCCIMAYNTDNPLVAERIRLGVENQGTGTIWAGLSANWSGERGQGSVESILERVEMVRQYKPEGVMFFAYGHFSDEELKALKEETFAIPAFAPRLKIK